MLLSAEKVRGRLLFVCCRPRGCRTACLEKPSLPCMLRAWATTQQHTASFLIPKLFRSLDEAVGHVPKNESSFCCAGSAGSWTFLCTASVFSRASQSDRSVNEKPIIDLTSQCNPGGSAPIAALLHSTGALAASVVPLPVKVQAAAHVKVEASKGLLDPAVVTLKLQQRLVQANCVVWFAEGVGASILEVGPAAKASKTAYRIVPSTRVEVTGESISSPTRRAPQDTSACPRSCEIFGECSQPRRPLKARQ